MRNVLLYMMLMFGCAAVTAQPYTFEGKSYDWKWETDNCISESFSLFFGCTREDAGALTIYLNRQGEVAYVFHHTTKVFQIQSLKDALGKNGDCAYLTGGSHELCITAEKLSLFIYTSSFSIEDAAQCRRQNAEVLDWLKGIASGGGTDAQPSRDEASQAAAEREAQERAQREAELRERERKAAEAAEEERRRQEEEARFRSQPLSARTDAVTVPERLASYPEGQAALEDYFQKNMKYPAIAREEGIQGTVIVRFIVERDGSFSSVEVAKSPDPSLSREAIRLIKSMPRWRPAFIDGTPVPSIQTQVIRFKL